MTRKQAISTAISVLMKQEDQSEEVKKAIVKLEEMKNGIPGKIWDDATIRGAIDRFIAENGRPPLVKELDSIEYLPPHPCVYQQYKMTAGRWLKENYPEYIQIANSHPYRHFSDEEIKAIFIQDFKRVNPSSLVQYSREKSRTAPGVTYLLKRLDAKTWSNLLKMCGLETKKEKKTFRIKHHLNITE